jgi:SAM-dependent methyltransferase
MSNQGEYISEDDNLARSYGRYLQKYIGSLRSNRGLAVDVGAGTGFFLPELLKAGFSQVVGIEPSAEAVAMAPANIRSLITCGLFTGDTFPEGTVDFISCFQTLEHIPSPDKLVADFAKALAPGGLVYCIAHDFGSFGVKLAGSRHPIVNAGHLVLFDRKTIRALFEKHFSVIDVFPIVNRYSVRYWLSLVPLPDRIKSAVTAILDRTGLSKVNLSLSMGNMGIIAKKR